MLVFDNDAIFINALFLLQKKRIVLFFNNSTLASSIFCCYSAFILMGRFNELAVCKCPWCTSETFLEQKQWSGTTPSL